MDTRLVGEMCHFKFNSNKFNELVLYIAYRSEEDPRFGATKLNKLLYYMDTRSYLDLGYPITGATYRHLQAGPVPTAIVDTKRQLVDAGDAKIEERPYFNYYQERLMALRDGDITLFMPEELKIINGMIEQLWEYNGTELSSFSHKDWGWRLTSPGEDIPYELAWMSPEPITLEDVEYGLQVARRHDLGSD